MIRSLLILALIVVVYYALKTIFLSALKSFTDQGTNTKLKGEDMVLDPECRTYVVKNRAVTRRIHGATTHFCSEACARKYEEKSK
ncbi:MAG TPA: hypothetical protein DCO77_08880 [Nitrospiraceae bacterium]|nr:hypothetical protein [Nitrospiraceae bacterium]